VDDNGREGKEEAIESRWMWAKRPVALEKCLIHVFDVRKIRP
jgi:hypothetical protein